MKEVAVRIHPDPTINVGAELAGDEIVVYVGDLDVESHRTLMLQVGLPPFELLRVFSQRIGLGRPIAAQDSNLVLIVFPMQNKY